MFELGSKKLVAEVREKLDQCMIRLNVALVGQIRAEKMTRSLVTE